jgi:hypothetical protein
VVLVREDSVRYGRDLIRNDPYLRGPAMPAVRMLTREGRAKIEAANPGQAVEVGNDELLGSSGTTAWIRRRR